MLEIAMATVETLLMDPPTKGQFIKTSLKIGQARWSPYTTFNTMVLLKEDDLSERNQIARCYIAPNVSSFQTFHCTRLLRNVG